MSNPYNIPIANAPLNYGSQNNTTTIIDTLNTNTFTDGTLFISNNIISNLQEVNGSNNLHDAVSKNYVDSIPFDSFKNYLINVSTNNNLNSSLVIFPTTHHWVSLNNAQNLVGMSSEGFVLVNDSPTAISYTTSTILSTNSVYWTSNLVWDNLIYSPTIERYYASGHYTNNESTLISVSTNAISWNTLTIISGILVDFVYGDKFVGVINSTTQSKFGTSTDAINWSITSPLTTGATTTITWESVCWNPDDTLYVAVGSGNLVNYSSNGSSWSVAQATTTSDWKEVIYTPNNSSTKYVARSTNLLEYSSNAITWTSASNGQTNFLLSWSPNASFFFSAIPASSYCSITSSTSLLSWSTITMTTVSNWNASTWVNDLNSFAVISNNSILYVNAVDLSGEYTPLQVINSFIKIQSISTNTQGVTLQFPTADNLYYQILESYQASNTGITPTTGYTFQTTITNVSDTIDEIVYLDLGSGGLTLTYGQSSIISLQKNSYVNVNTILTNKTTPTFSVAYTSSINFFDVSSNNEESLYKFNSGLLLPENSLNIRSIFSITNLNGVTYTKNQLLNGIIDRTNTPVTDSLPTNAVLTANETLVNNDTYTFTIRNKGSGVLTVLLNDIGIDYNNVLGVFITLNSLETSTCSLIYNSFTGTFYAHEIYRGALVL
jgi:hypothetical protein